MSILTNSLFWQVFQDSGSINESRGMKKYDFREGDAHLFTFSKTHSYGEYIFDWAWANAYEQNGYAYYPKLTSMVPFTPATMRHFQGSQIHWSGLLRQHDELLKTHHSAHFLFTTEDEQKFLGEEGYLLRDSFQYHFFNDAYSSFEDFLRAMKTKKAKQIRKEREFPSLKIEALTGPDLKPGHALEMYNFYLMTLSEKQAIPYLTQNFYELLFSRLPEHVLYVRASENDFPVAGALFFYDQERLYGRYWGAKLYVPHLHFELCYYQGIEFAIKKNLKVFEAGAQGEHKIARGFRPVYTRSAHQFNHPGFKQAIRNFIEEERLQVAENIRQLSLLLPFKDPSL